jgi:phosphoribosylpyrophosphate synthetase
VLVQRGLTDVSVVAPDEGALARADAVIRAAGIRTPLARLRKQRDATASRTARSSAQSRPGS